MSHRLSCVRTFKMQSNHTPTLNNRQPIPWSPRLLLAPVRIDAIAVRRNDEPASAAVTYGERRARKRWRYECATAREHSREPRAKFATEPQSNCKSCEFHFLLPLYMRGASTGILGMKEICGVWRQGSSRSEGESQTGKGTGFPTQHEDRAGR